MNMFNRRDAICSLITNRYGRKQELIDQIGEMRYNCFLFEGFIYEPAKLAPVPPKGVVREWIATDAAYNRAKILCVKPNKKFHLPSSPSLSFWSKIRSLLLSLK